MDYSSYRGGLAAWCVYNRAMCRVNAPKNNEASFLSPVKQSAMASDDGSCIEWSTGRCPDLSDLIRSIKPMDFGPSLASYL
jgi:hypothetical protein